MAERTAFGLWKYVHYFQFVNEKEKNITVKCTLCVGEKLLSTAKNSTSNLKKHLASKHQSSTLVAKPAEEDDGGAPASKQQRLSFNSAKTVPISEVHKLVAGFI